jgi:hypothetical protein
VQNVSVLPQQPALFSSQPLVAQSSSAAPTAEVLRSTLSQNVTETKDIREQISSLRDVIKSEPVSNRDTTAYKSLTDRLTALEGRLSSKEKENSELQEQLDRQLAEKTNSAAAVQPGPSTVAGGNSSSAGLTSGQASGLVPQGGTDSGLSSLNTGGSSGIASLSSSAGALKSAPVISSGNAALLSKYGVQSGSVQGALIIANSSNTIDYQNLRSQSADNVLPLSMTQEEFNLIAANDQAALGRYLDQVKAMSGDVIRLEIRSQGEGNQMMEIFVLKKGDEISIIPGSHLPSRGIASELPTGREFTLNDLRNELGN